MTIPTTAVHLRSTAVRLQRLLVVLSLAVALIAIPMVRPNDASAMGTSERLALRACGTLGGRV